MHEYLVVNICHTVPLIQFNTLDALILPYTLDSGNNYVNLILLHNLLFPCHPQFFRS